MASPKLAHLSDDVAVLPAGRTAGLQDLPLVSVIVICFNHAPFLEKCLTSILQQTYRRLQIIVVENASTDNSRHVLEQFCKEHAANEGAVAIEPVFSASNGRELGAMLQGFAIARGPYVAFVDGDDWLLPHCIETHIKAHLVSRIAVGVTSVDMYQSSGDDIVIGTGKQVSDYVMSKRGQQTDFCRMENLAGFDFPPSGTDWELKQSDLHLVPPSLGHEWYWSPTSGLCFRREMLELFFDPTPTVRDGVDGYLVRGVCCLTGGITIDRSLAVYRMHGNNLFSKHPALENILQYSRAQCADLDMNISEAVLHCLREQMPRLAENLEAIDIYIGAVHSLSRVALNRKAGSYSSYTVRFLIEQQALIIKHFGDSTYKRWLRRYMKPKDYIGRAFGRA